MSQHRSAVAMLGTDLSILLVTTTRIWWRLLPRLLVLHLLGYLGFQLALKLAVVVGLHSAWAALVIFSTGFIAVLASIVLTLRLVGRELGVRELVPDDEVESDDRDSSVSRLLALTLLPFLGIYTAFGFVADASQTLLIESLFVNGGALGITDSILGKLRLTDASATKIAVVVAVIVGTYLLRRGLDVLHERTGWRPLGLLGAFVEGFFVLVTITAGVDIVARAVLWLTDRQFMVWIGVVTGAVGRAYDAVLAVLPGFLVRAVEYLAENWWPILVDEITQPLVWLAVAALVYGSRVISVAELWRKGRPLVARRDRVATQLAHRAHQPGRAGRMGLELREAFLGDIDDKYLPTLHSLRLVLRAGFIFLAAYVLAYALVKAANNYLGQIVNAVAGGHLVTFSMTWAPVLDLLTDLPTEPWRLCLLGVAFHRCLLIFRARASQVAGDGSSTAVVEPAGVAR